jgi:subtilisin family serine protease
MIRWVPLLLMTVLMSACADTPSRIESRALAGAAPESTDRFIIAAVDNRPAALMARAGSTPRGYDTIAPYGPTPTAQRVMQSLEEDYGLREVNAWPIEPLHMHCAVLKMPEGTDRVTLVETLSHDRRVKLVQPLQTFATRSGEYNDPYVELQRGFHLMDVADAHRSSRGEGVTVAIIDTGADTDHPDLSRRIAVAANFVDSDARRFRSDRHGTEVAGVIAAIANNHEGIVGIAPLARLLVYKACWQTRIGEDAAQCNSFTLARALVAALDAHAQVINLSLVGPPDPLLSRLIGEGLRRGIVIVGAANSEAPAGGSLLHQSGVIEVASSERTPAPISVLLAPGREILTLLPGGHYDFASGDSMATAQVTGVVALLLGKNRALSPAETYRILRDTSTRSGDAADGGEHVDACAALFALTGGGSCAGVGADQRFAEKERGPLALH